MADPPKSPTSSNKNETRNKNNRKKRSYNYSDPEEDATESLEDKNASTGAGRSQKRKRRRRNKEKSSIREQTDRGDNNHRRIIVNISRKEDRDSEKNLVDSLLHNLLGSLDRQKDPDQEDPFTAKDTQDTWQEEEPELPVEKEEEVFHIDLTRRIDKLDGPVACIADLIEVGKLYEKENFLQSNYSINVRAIHGMIPSLQELEALIGLKDVKTRLLDQIMFFSQDLHDPELYLPPPPPPEEEQPDMGPLTGVLHILPLQRKKNPLLGPQELNKHQSCFQNDDHLDMLHTIIEGPPGTGKTIFGKILARIYLSLGITYSDTFKIVRRSDLIGEYLGHTAMKTQRAIDEAMGGVLFIDEAYSLGSGAKKFDSYSKECIDTINQNLSERKGKWVCIIAGYADELEKNIFSVNPGLKRRFSFRYRLEKYTWQELSQIFIYKVKKMEWDLDLKAQLTLERGYLQHKMDQFPNFGGDIETLLLHTKIEHGRRVFGTDPLHHKVINSADIEKGLQRFMSYRKTKVDKPPDNLYV